MPRARKFLAPLRSIFRSRRPAARIVGLASAARSDSISRPSDEEFRIQCMEAIIRLFASARDALSCLSG